ncbi:MAG: ABC-F family ATP-binding cassette domain-containing protein [Pseudomonadota bacterium]
MLQIRDLTFSRDGRRLLDGASVVVPGGHRVGLVGRNGTGKTTLFSLIRGELPTEGGDIALPAQARIGGVAQEVPSSATTLLDTVLAADEERAALLAEAEHAEDPHRIAEIQTRLVDIDAHSAEARAAAILSGLGFDEAAQARTCAEFSGGWRMRVALAAVLFAAPDLLLLDEPTNYLDLEGTVWLESFLARYPHTMLVISHDRALLNRSVGAILHLRDGKLTLYRGAYDTFDHQRRAQAEQQQALAKKQAAERAHIQRFVDRFRYKASKARQAQSRLKMLARMQPINVAGDPEVAPFRFQAPDELSPPLLSFDGVAVGYDAQPVLRDLSLRIDPDDRIALLGANGEGKSTLAKLLAGVLAPLAGDVVKSSKLRIGYFAQHMLEGLHADETPLQHIQRVRPEEKPATLRARLAGGGIDASLAERVVARLSGGQRARLALLLATLDAPHLLILDEPTNHLDVESREALIHALTDYSGAVILISHDSYLVECVADRLWLVNDGRVAPWEQDMAAYRDMLLARQGLRVRRADRKEAKTQARPSSGDLARLKADVSRCEVRVAKLEEMRAQIDARLADPALYDSFSSDRVTALEQKRAEVVDGLDRAEALWLAAQERLEAAEQAPTA